MRKTATNLTLTWGAATGTEEMKGNIQKCDIKEEAGRVGTGGTCDNVSYNDKGLCEGNGDNWTAETKRYNIQLVFVRGTKKN